MTTHDAQPTTTRPDPDPDRKVVLVTGATSGIGAAVARHLASRGHQVVATGRRTERLESLRNEADAGDGPRIDARPLDVTDRQAYAALVADVVADHGRLDVLIGNAGAMLLSRLDAGLVEEWDQMIDINVRGLLHGIAATLPVFRDQGSGHVVTVASIGAHQVSETAGVYCATKYAAWALTEALRLESDPSLRVTTISPGVVESELAGHITDPYAAELMTGYRAVSIPPAAIAHAIDYAISQPADVDVNEMVVRPAGQR